MTAPSVTADELAALENEVLHAHLDGRVTAGSLASLLAKLAPGNATTRLLRRVERRTSSALEVAL